MASKYHPEDSMLHHLIQAYKCRKFDKNDLYNKHMEYAMDHSSMGDHEYTKKDLENMVNEGKELFHDMDEDEIKNPPLKFEGDPFDSEIGKANASVVEATKGAKKIGSLYFDHRENPELDDLKKALKPLGVHVYESPSMDGQDMFGFIFSSLPLNKAEIKEYEISINAAQEDEEE